MHKYDLETRIHRTVQEAIEPIVSEKEAMELAVDALVDATLNYRIRLEELEDEEN